MVPERAARGLRRDLYAFFMRVPAISMPSLRRRA